MRWTAQELATESDTALPGLARLSNLVRSVSTPEFAGVRFHEVLARTALNRVPGASSMPFGWTINPYRGCSHACVYCLSGETMILMADGSQKPLWDVRVGDEVVGTRTEGRYRRYVRSTVLAHWQTRKRAYEIRLEDGTRIVASGDHRFLTERGWKHVAPAEVGQRPYLTTNNALVGFGSSGLSDVPTPSWRQGFLAGIFDAEGSTSRGVLRISNKNERILQHIREGLNAIGVAHVTEGPRANGVSTVRVRGGLPARQRFFGMTQPTIVRKLSVLGAAVKSSARLGIASVTSLDRYEDMYDITTTTGDFIAEGVVSHNCFARNTHTYLDLDSGRDFDNEIIVKVNVAEVLAKELAKPSWQRHPVALGTNTDPYQRAEGRYRLMPGIIAALADSGTPFSILTKGTLLRRDLPLIAEAAEHVEVDLAMSIAIYDDELQQSIEPGTPTTKARLDTVRAVRDAGLDCAVFLMPVLPYLTDTLEHLDRALTQAKAAGATSVLYTALHLRPGTREWFLRWLSHEHPALLPKYTAMYAASAYAPKDYRRWLGQRIQPLIREHGLERGEMNPTTGTLRPRALGRASLIQAELPAQLQPTLF